MIDPAALGHRQRVHQAHRVRIAEVEALEPLRHDDREPAVGREVEVVRILDRYRARGLGGAGVDRREAVAEVVVDIERPQVVGGRDVLRQGPDREGRDDLQRPLADHVDGVAHAVRHVHQRRIASHDRTEVTGARRRCTRSRHRGGWPRSGRQPARASRWACSARWSRGGRSTRSRRAATLPVRRRGQFCGRRRGSAGRGFSARLRARRTSLPSRDPNPPNQAVRLSTPGTRRGSSSDFAG